MYTVKVIFSVITALIILILLRETVGRNSKTERWILTLVASVITVDLVLMFL